jgi:hypothetical protein
MTTTSNLHIFGIDMNIAHFPKALAQGAIEWSITGGIVGPICNCRDLNHQIDHHSDGWALT